MNSRDAGRLGLVHSVLREGVKLAHVACTGRTRGQGLICHSHLEQHLNSDAAPSW